MGNASSDTSSCQSSEVGAEINLGEDSLVETKIETTSKSMVKKTKKGNVPEAVSEAKELILAASLRLRVLKEDYQRIGWALDDLIEELDDVEAGEKTAKHKQSQSILRDVEALIAKNAER